MPTEQIITITLNPAIDKSVKVEKIVPEAKLRCSPVKNEPGGGGINVSKALKRLGMESLAIFAAGGHNGNLLKDLIRIEDIPFEAIGVAPETRENFIVLETSSNNQYRFNIEAALFQEEDASKCIQVLNNLSLKPTILVASGSLPGGMPENFYAELAKWANTNQAKFILDTSGNPLRLALNEKLYLVKPNLSELRQLTGRDTLSKEEAVAASRELLHEHDINMIVVSMGEEGAVLVTDAFHEFVAAPKVIKRSTVGAGDSMVAGMVYMLSRQSTPSEMIRFGIACGTAATMNWGTELFHADDVNRLYEQFKPVL